MHNENNMGTNYCGIILSAHGNPSCFFFSEVIFLIKTDKINKEKSIEVSLEIYVIV